MTDLDEFDWYALSNGLSTVMPDGTLIQEEPEMTEIGPAFYSVAIYLETLQYGGPEEGGWYYDAGVRVDNPQELRACHPTAPQIFPTKEGAIAFAALVNDTMEGGINKGRRPTSSVLSTGRYVARVEAGYPPPVYPAVRPYYE